MIAHQIRPSAAAERLSAEGAFEVLARARELEALGRDIIHLSRRTRFCHGRTHQGRGHRRDRSR